MATGSRLPRLRHPDRLHIPPNLLFDGKVSRLIYSYHTESLPIIWFGCWVYMVFVKGGGASLQLRCKSRICRR